MGGMPVWGEIFSDGGGRGGHGGRSIDLDKRISGLLKSQLGYYRDKWRLIALVFGQPADPTFKEQILPKLKYWHCRTSDKLDMICIGYSIKAKAFDDLTFAESVKWLGERSTWEFSGQTDLVLLNATLSSDTTMLSMDTNQMVAVDLQGALADGAFRSIPGFFEELFRFADAYEGDDPTWDFSDAQGRRLSVSGLKSVLLSCVPKAVRKEARAAFHLRVREYKRPAA